MCADYDRDGVGAFFCSEPFSLFYWDYLVTVEVNKISDLDLVSFQIFQRHIATRFRAEGGGGGSSLEAPYFNLRSQEALLVSYVEYSLFF